ncbi:unnamed protein product [Vicia faba]|uniref:Uncharacterized protein n=1 Tax=Vicia faba TaxID=3906 RepID=A0AAV0ZLT1_VICFA|nr:unnamed protein product [Vicia faba]
MIEIVKSQLNAEEALKFKPLQLQQDFTVLGDDEEESSFQSSSTNPDDIIIPTKKLKVSSFVFNDEHLVEENDDVGLSAMIATQALVPILIPSNFNSELVVNNIDIVKYEFETNFISDLSSSVRDRFKDIVSRVFMNLHPAKWLADGSNLGYFHDDADYEIPLKPPDAISKLEKECTPEALTRTTLFDIQQLYHYICGNFCLYVDMFAILGVIEKNNILHDALLVSSCLMDCIKSLLEKHEIIRGFYLGLVLTTGYECNDIIGSKFFVLAATHGSVIHACKLF